MKSKIEYVLWVLLPVAGFHSFQMLGDYLQRLYEPLLQPVTQRKET